MTTGLVRRVGDCPKYLQKTLDTYLKQAKFNPRGNPNVLDVGCGNSCVNEFWHLSQYYEQNFGLHMQFTGVDISEDKYERAKKALGDLATFIPGDAQTIGDFVKGEQGLVIMRNPDPEQSDEQRVVWYNILQSLRRTIMPDGLVLATHFNFGGYLCLLGLFHNSMYNLMINGKNDFPGPEICGFPDEFPGGVMAHDRYILVASKQAQISFRV